MSLSPDPHDPVSPFITGPCKPVSLSPLTSFFRRPHLPSFSSHGPSLTGPFHSVSLSITDRLCPTSRCLTDLCPLTLPSPLGVERTLVLPGSQTAFDLDDVRAGLSYTVRVSARVGTREGGFSILTVRRGEHCRRLVGDNCLPHSVLVLTPDLLFLTPRAGNLTCHPRAAGRGIRCNASKGGLGTCSWSQWISD